MRAPRLSTRVAWSVSPVARWRKVARLLPGLALLVLELASGGSDILTCAEPNDPRVPANPRDHREQQLGTVKVSVRGAGLPDARVRAAGPDADVEFRGHGVLLAHLGTLGRWPEPDLEPEARAFG